MCLCLFASSQPVCMCYALACKIAWLVHRAKCLLPLLPSNSHSFDAVDRLKCALCSNQKKTNKSGDRETVRSNDVLDDQLEWKIMMRNIWNWYHTENCGHTTSMRLWFRIFDSSKSEKFIINTESNACYFISLHFTPASWPFRLRLWMGYGMQCISLKSRWFIRCLQCLWPKTFAFVSIPLRFVVSFHTLYYNITQRAVGFEIRYLVHIFYHFFVHLFRTSFRFYDIKISRSFGFLVACTVCFRKAIFSSLLWRVCFRTFNKLLICAVEKCLWGEEKI